MLPEYFHSGYTAREDGDGGDNWSYTTSVKSSPPTNQHPALYRPDTLPVTQLSVSKHWREKCPTNRNEKQETNYWRIWQSGRVVNASTLVINFSPFFHHLCLNTTLHTKALMWPNPAFSSSGWMRSFKNSWWSRSHVSICVKYHSGCITTITRVLFCFIYWCLTAKTSYIMPQ